MSSRQASHSPAALPFAPFMGFIVFPMMFQTVPTAALQFLSVNAPPPPPPPPARPAQAPAPATPPALPAPRVPGAGLPTPLVELLRGVDGPFVANEVFSVAPSQPILPVEEETPADEWYAITRGRFVGVVDQYALSDVAITGVSQSVRKAYTTQGLALKAFNQALTWGGVQVV